jgi:hypothetical protein
MKVATESPDRFSRLAAAGLTATIFFYFAINLMMVMGLAPVVGIPLPLVSYGGSAMMTVMLCLGMLMAIERQNAAVDVLGGGRGARGLGMDGDGKDDGAGGEESCAQQQTKIHVVHSQGFTEDYAGAAAKATRRAKRRRPARHRC